MLPQSVFDRWPASSADALQLYSLPTPNGVKVSAMLEEIGLPYDAHLINIMDGTQFSDEYIAINPNSKIPALYDPKGLDGKPQVLWESGAILLYLAEKSGKFMPRNAAEKYETLQWLMWQMGGVGPMFGQFGFFKSFGGKDWEDKKPLERYATETARLLKVLDTRLEGRDFIMGPDYTIADMAVWPWVVNLEKYHKSHDALGVTDSKNILAWLERTAGRPASERAISIPAI